MKFFASKFFGSKFWAAKFFSGGSGDVVTTTTISTTWKSGGVAFGNQSLDYVVKSSTNVIVADGVGTTLSSGQLTVTIPIAYSGQLMTVLVDNVAEDMDTTNRFFGAQVVAAA